MMRQLALWQLRRGYCVGFGLLLSKAWPTSYREQMVEIADAGVTVMTGGSPNLFGTAAILYHQFSNPISKWTKKFRPQDEPLVVHFHNAWLSGAYMPLQTPQTTAVVTYHGILGRACATRSAG